MTGTSTTTDTVETASGQTSLPPAHEDGVQEFSNAFGERSELHWMASDALQLMHNAFIEKDELFPRPACRTLVAATASGRPQNATNGIEAFTQKLLREGALSAQDTEKLAILGLFELSRLSQGKASAIAEFARPMLWLECNSELPLLTHTAPHLASEELKQLALAITRLLRAPDMSEPTLSRGEKWAALSWLGTLEHDLRSSLETQARLAISPPVPTLLSNDDRTNGSRTRTLSGRLAIAPKGAFSTAVAAFSGWLLLRQLLNWALRVFLAYRASAEVTLSERGMEIRENRSLLGRKLRERTTLLAMPQIRQLSREVRYARAGTYAGLAALGLGSVLGMRLFVDGLRVPGLSGPLLLLGLLIVLLGLGLDFALANWLDASTGRCRFIVVAEGGKGLCLAGVEPARVDAILSELSNRMGHAS